MSACSNGVDEEQVNAAADLGVGRRGRAWAPPMPAPWSSMRVIDGSLFDRCGERLLLRGVNKDVVALDRTGRSFAEIATTGANTVRLVWKINVSPAEADLPLGRAIENGLAPIWEMHDATGDFSKLGAVIDYWTRPDTVAMVKKYERDIIVNIANEAGGAGISDDTFVSTYSSAINRLRAAAIAAPIMIDATGWGQNVEQLLRTGTRLIDGDPEHNLILSWHEYSANATESARITTSLEAARRDHLPLVIGEFAGIAPDGCDRVVPYAHVLGEALRLDIGWLAWSWDNTNGSCRIGGVSGFDMVADGVHAATLVSGWPKDVVHDHIGSLAITSRRTAWQQRRVCRDSPLLPTPSRPITPH